MPLITLTAITQHFLLKHIKKDIDYIDDNGEIVRHGDYAHFRYSNMSIYYNSRKDAEKKRNTAV